MFKEVRFDGGGGDKLGGTLSLDAAVAYLVSYQSSHSKWTEAEARAALEDAVENNTAVVVDYNGDGFVRLLPC